MKYWTKGLTCETSRNMVFLDITHWLENLVKIDMCLLHICFTQTCSTFYHDCLLFLNKCLFICLIYWLIACLLIYSNAILLLLMNDCFLALVWLITWLFAHDDCLIASLAFCIKNLLILILCLMVLASKSSVLVLGFCFMSS